MMDLDWFFKKVAHAENPVVAFDYDGTLSPLQKDPKKAVPYEGVRERLSAIQGTKTSLMMVTGRPAHELHPLLQLHKPVEIWGVHGWEQLLPDGTRNVEPMKLGQERALEKISEWIPEMEAYGARCERKLASVAIHWRGEDEKTIQSIKALAREKWNTSSTLKRRLAWHDFDGGIEWRVKGRNKGHVVEIALTRSETVAFLGDDLTDEDGFYAIQGRGLGVLVRPELRQTYAQAWIRPPSELLEFLDRWIDACH